MQKPRSHKLQSEGKKDHHRAGRPGASQTWAGMSIRMNGNKLNGELLTGPLNRKA